MNTALLTTPSLSVDASGTRHVPASAGAQRLAPGAVVAGRYVIRGELGRGGFAVVYDAEHLGLGRRVAVKIVHLDDDMPVELLARARREARNAALVRHPNILEVFDTGTLEDGSPFLVMERLQGETLAKRIARSGLSIPAIVETGRQLLLALEALAAHSIIHRDVKPENVMLHDGGDGRLIVKLVDFGISKRTKPAADVSLTRDGTLVGTPSYMSPEQLRGEDLDVRTDIYSAGAVLYEALTGRPPHDRTSVQEVMLATLHDAVRDIRPLRPDCPVELERIVLNALSKKREDRYPEASAMRLALEQVADTHALPTASKAWRAPQPMTPAPNPRAAEGTRADPLARAMRAIHGRRPHTHVLVAGIVAAVVALGAGTVLQARKAENASSLPSRGPLVRPVSRVETLPVRGAELPPSAESAPVLTPQVRYTSSDDGRAAPQPRRQRVRKAARVSVPVQEAVPAVAPAGRVSPATASPDSRPLIRKALAAYTRGQYAAAEDLYREVLAAHPHDPDALRGLGVVAAHRGSRAEARAAFERYLQQAPAAGDADAIRARLSALRDPP